MDRLVYAVDTLQHGEEQTWRRIARADRSFDAIAQRACRLGYLSASLHGRLDPEAALGLAIIEAEALLVLAGRAATTVAQSRTKVALFRTHGERFGHETTLAAMLRASRVADAIALAGAHGPIVLAHGFER